MNCAICKRPLLEGAPACVVCGAPVEASQPAGMGGRVSSLPAAVSAGALGYGQRPSIPTAPPGSAYGPPAAYGAPQSPYGAPPPQPQPPPGYYGGHANPPMPAQMQAQMQAPMQQGAAFPGAGPSPFVHPMNAPNNMAIASFVCGMLGLVPLWIGFILCILAIVFGVLGLQRARQLPAERGKGLAIAGLVLGILFILPAGCGL